MDSTARQFPISPHAAQATASDRDWSGRTLGDFHLLRRLGQGGMGQVYLAEQLSLKRKAAIKIMRPDVAAGDTSFRRFRGEAEAVARITHPNIVQIYAFGEFEGTHFLALEYVEGVNLGDYLRKKGPPDVPLALSIMRQVATALQRAGELGIVHRDIKPENILLTRRGEVKVTDFGLSRCFAADRPTPNLTETGMTMGTPLYMSPEQVQGTEVDPRSDIYSLGVTCYEMLAGQPPFRGQSAMELALQHVKVEPRPLTEIRPDLPRELCSVIEKMMAKERTQRHQSCAELLEDLSKLRQSLVGLRGAAGGSRASFLRAAVTSVSPALGRRSLMAAAGISVLISFVAGGTVAWWRDRTLSAVQPLALGEEGPSAVQLTEQQKEEQFLRQAVEQYRDPSGDSGRLDLGVRHGLELGLFYLNHNQLDDADKFFTGLMQDRKITAYQTLGKLGHAIVLARQDRPDESNKEFLQLVGSRQPPDRLPFLLNQPHLRYEIARALDANYANAPGDFPARLKELRDPPKRNP